MSYPEPPTRDVGLPISFGDASAVAPARDVSIPLAFGQSEAGQSLPTTITGRLTLRGVPTVVVTAPGHRGHSTRLQTTWQASDHIGARWSAPWGQTHASRVLGHSGIGMRARALRLRFSVPWGRTDAAKKRTSVTWWIAASRVQRANAAWQEAIRVRAAVDAVWQLSFAAGYAAQSRWQEANDLRWRVVTPWQRAIERDHRYCSANVDALSRLTRLTAPWQEAELFTTTGSPLPIYIRPGTLPPGIPSVVVPLVFVDRYPSNGWSSGALSLVFGKSGPVHPAQIVVAIRSTYIVQNDVTLYRLPSGSEFKASAFTLDIDADSWTFGWSATLHSSARSHLVRNAPGDRIEVQCVVNGITLHLVVDGVSRDRAFPTDRIAVRGRGRAAELGDASLTFGNTVVRTAQQLMADVLTVNNVSMGWGIDWQIEDWLVPAGAWVHRGSYITALQDIAGAAGAYLQPHLTDKVLRVLPRYPIAPWDWATDLTPDVELPVDVTTTEGVEEVDRPDFNGVFVGGIGVGVFGPVVRTGTVGDKLAPQVLHPLITAPQAHRQAGLAVLGDTGRKERVSVSTLLLPEAGIILPGKAVRYVSDNGARVGLVRRTGLSMQAWPQLTQTLEVETHVE